MAAVWIWSAIFQHSHNPLHSNCGPDEFGKKVNFAMLGSRSAQKFRVGQSYCRNEDLKR